MAEEWIEALAADMQRRYHQQAAEDQRAAERQAVLQRRASAFWHG